MAFAFVFGSFIAFIFICDRIRIVLSPSVLHAITSQEEEETQCHHRITEQSVSRCSRSKQTTIVYTHCDRLCTAESTAFVRKQVTPAATHRSKKESKQEQDGSDSEAPIATPVTVKKKKKHDGSHQKGKYNKSNPHNDSWSQMLIAQREETKKQCPYVVHDDKKEQLYCDPCRRHRIGCAMATGVSIYSYASSK
eukprot:1020277_1